MIARTEKPLSFRPRLVVAYGDSARAALNARHFRRLGWEVHQACSGPEARQLVRALRPQVVLLDIDLRGESAWLTCAKLTLGCTEPRVILLAEEVTPTRAEFAEVVGAAGIVSRQAGLSALVEEVHGAALSTSA